MTFIKSVIIRKILFHRDRLLLLRCRSRQDNNNKTKTVLNYNPVTVLAVWHFKFRKPQNALRNRMDPVFWPKSFAWTKDAMPFIAVGKQRNPILCFLLTFKLLQSYLIIIILFSIKKKKNLFNFTKWEFHVICQWFSSLLNTFFLKVL